MSTPRIRFALIVCLVLAAPAAATDPPAAPAAPAEEAALQPSGAPTATHIKSQFRLLRFQEDWRGLKDPEATTDHWLPEIKQIELAEDWDLSFGGQVRYQWKDDTNRNLLGTFPNHNEFSLLRYRLHGDLRIQDDVRFFVETISADIHGQKTSDAPPQPIDRNDWDFLNAFVEFIGSPDFRFRFGRTEMLYGAQRLISPLDWGNTRRTFEGVVGTFRNGNMTTDAFVTHPVIVDPRHQDESNESRLFSGIYNTWALEGGRTVDAYLLDLNEDDPVITSGDGTLSDADLWTAGSRYAGKDGPWDWDCEAALQRGHWGRDTARAEMLALTGGHTLADLPGTPRISLDVDWASGDDNSTDGTQGTFNQLFPLGHAYFGYIDLVGRQNIMAISPSARWKLGDTAWFRAAWHDFNLDNDSDALYNAGGAATLADPSGSSGNHVGQEWDLTLGWAPSRLAPHSEFLFGYSYFNPGNFVEHLGSGHRPQLLYFQYQFTF